MSKRPFPARVWPRAKLALHCVLVGGCQCLGIQSVVGPIKIKMAASDSHTWEHYLQPQGLEGGEGGQANSLSQ